MVEANRLCDNLHHLTNNINQFTIRIRGKVIIVDYKIRYTLILFMYNIQEMKKVFLILKRAFNCQKIAS